MTRHDKWVIACRKGEEAHENTTGDKVTKLAAARTAIEKELADTASTAELCTMVAVFTTGARPESDFAPDADKDLY